MKKITHNHYKIIIKDISEGKGEAFEVFVPAFNAHILGDTIEKAIGAYNEYFESEVNRRSKENISMPKPDVIKEGVKQVPLRLAESTYEKVLSEAKEKGMSFNGYVNLRLES